MKSNGFRKNENRKIEIIKSPVTNFGFNTPHKKLTFKYMDIYNDDVQVRVPSIDKAQSILNWNPKVDIEDGLKETIKYFKLHLK